MRKTYKSYIKMVDSMGNATSIEEVIKNFKKFTSIIRKYSNNELELIKIDVDTWVEEYRNIGLLASFFAAFTAFILFALTTPYQLLSEANKNMKEVIFFIILIVFFIVLLALGLVVISYYKRFRKLLLFQKVLELYLKENRAMKEKRNGVLLK
ncbi:hypothetical protein OB236_13195 [Paenibacillus sp. WQ 127069]|uniref:Uncharacterized protein n=1 Tax=Paenibacillus baimaensis TaxID=2982185 RepID=A0ABT2UEP2_9BACL|nr:hypothetical protein [Paenibacillus sp. WQ 127069]MCU6793075.1 hypothetical protein [Paenibacillus sp. WQ 127069]